MVNWPLALLKDEIMVAQRPAAVPARTSRARNMRTRAYFAAYTWYKLAGRA